MPAPAPDCWLHPAVAVAASPIAGRGLFATAPITAATVVARAGGRVVAAAELAGLRAATEPALDTLAVGDDRHLVLPPGTALHFVNHSCAPNLGWTEDYALTALRDVTTGEELTSDYATATADPDFVLRCHCETYRCRQMVTGDDWRIPELQRRYAGHWTPALRRLVQADAQAHGQTDGQAHGQGR